MSESTNQQEPPNACAPTLPSRKETPTTPPRVKRTVARFLFTFALVIAAYYLLSGTAAFRDRFFPWYLELNARGAARLLALIGQGTKVSDNLVYSNRFSFTVQRGCDAVEPTVLFLAAVMASPVTWRLRAVGLLSGMTLLAAINLLRLVSLFLTGVYWEAAFHVMHVDVWQAIFIFLALLFWVLWALWAVKRKAVATP
jgi:exosortase/archaeosortase family protein